MLRLVLSVSLAIPACAQIVPGLTIPPSGNNQKAAVTQYIGPVKITIDYSSPAVHATNGQDRRGGKLILETTPGMVKKYQTDRLNEKAAPKTVNEEVAFLLRLCGDQCELIGRGFGERRA